MRKSLLFSFILLSSFVFSQKFNTDSLRVHKIKVIKKILLKDNSRSLTELNYVNDKGMLYRSIEMYCGTDSLNAVTCDSNGFYTRKFDQDLRIVFEEYLVPAKSYWSSKEDVYRIKTYSYKDNTTTIQLGDKKEVFNTTISIRTADAIKNKTTIEDLENGKTTGLVVEEKKGDYVYRKGWTLTRVSTQKKHNGKVSLGRKLVTLYFSEKTANDAKNNSTTTVLKTWQGKCLKRKKFTKKTELFYDKKGLISKMVITTSRAAQTYVYEYLN